jgi:AcrR family transcriptional regulator
VVQLPASLSKAPVGHKRLSPEDLGEQQRQRILGALIGVFAKRGFQASTIDHLVGAAKIGVGSFYAHFEGKDDCLVQAYDKIVADVRGRIAAALPNGGSWPERALVGLDAVLRFGAEEPMAARVALLEAQTGGPAPVRRYNETLEEVADFLGRGREQSELAAALPLSFEEATASGLAWLLQGRLARGEVRDNDALFRELAEAMLEPYLGVENTRKEIENFLGRSG